MVRSRSLVAPALVLAALAACAEFGTEELAEVKPSEEAGVPADASDGSTPSPSDGAVSEADSGVEPTVPVTPAEGDAATVSGAGGFELVTGPTCGPAFKSDAAEATLEGAVNHAGTHSCKLCVANGTNATSFALQGNFGKAQPGTSYEAHAFVQPLVGGVHQVVLALVAGKAGNSNTVVKTSGTKGFNNPAEWEELVVVPQWAGAGFLAVGDDVLVTARISKSGGVAVGDGTCVYVDDVSVVVKKP